MQVLFVCTGNICRSPMGEGFFNHLARKRDLLYWATSAGTSSWRQGDPPTSYGIRAAEELYGVNIAHLRSKSVTSQQIHDADLILGLEEHHVMHMLRMIPDARNKILTVKEWAYGLPGGIDDPYGGSYQVYLDCAKEIYEAIVAGLNRMEGADAKT